MILGVLHWYNRTLKTSLGTFSTCTRKSSCPGFGYGQSGRSNLTQYECWSESIVWIFSFGLAIQAGSLVHRTARLLASNARQAMPVAHYGTCSWRGLLHQDVLSSHPSSFQVFQLAECLSLGNLFFDNLYAAASNEFPPSGLNRLNIFGHSSKNLSISVCGIVSLGPCWRSDRVSSVPAKVQSTAAA